MQMPMSCIDRHQDVTASNKIRQQQQAVKSGWGESITLLSDGEKKGKINRCCCYHCHCCPSDNDDISNSNHYYHVIGFIIIIYQLLQ